MKSALSAVLFLVLCGDAPRLTSSLLLSRTSFTKFPLPFSLYRGGAVTDLNPSPSLSSSLSPLSEPNQNPLIIISIISNFGSKYLNQRMQFQMKRNQTVRELKEALSAQYPGHPPASLQNLYFGLQKLENNSQKLSEISQQRQRQGQGQGRRELRVLPLRLDLISGTTNYQNVRSVGEAVEAFVALEVHRSALARQMAQLLAPSSAPEADKKVGSRSDESTSHSSRDDSLVSLQMFHDLNQTLFETHQSAIERALEIEREPSLREGTTVDNLGYQTIDGYLDSRTSLQRFLETEFVFTSRLVRSLALYSLVWIVSTPSLCHLSSSCFYSCSRTLTGTWTL
jgi:hypothetical protein